MSVSRVPDPDKPVAVIDGVGTEVNGYLLPSREKLIYLLRIDKGRKCLPNYPMSKESSSAAFLKLKLPSETQTFSLIIRSKI